MRLRHMDKCTPQSFAGRQGSAAVKSLATLDRRDAGRVPFEAQVSYFSCDMTGVARGKGYLADLSKTGCKIVGSPLKTGSRGTLVIRLDDEQPSLCVAGFEVSWATGDSFGVRFPHLNVELRHRLQELVLRCATFKGSSDTHTAFRLA